MVLASDFFVLMRQGIKYDGTHERRKSASRDGVFLLDGGVRAEGAREPVESRLARHRQLAIPVARKHPPQPLTLPRVAISVRVSTRYTPGYLWAVRIDPRGSL